MTDTRASKDALSGSSLRGVLPLTGAALIASVGSAYTLIPNQPYEGRPLHETTPIWAPDRPTSSTLTETQRGASDWFLSRAIEWDDAWFGRILESIYDLLSLQQNWDSYGAAPIKKEFAASAATLLQSVMDRETPVPAVVPTTRGGIQIEWHTGGVDLELEIESTSKIKVWCEDGRVGTSWEEELSSNLEKLRDILASLSRHAQRRSSHRG